MQNSATTTITTATVCIVAFVSCLSYKTTPVYSFVTNSIPTLSSATTTFHNNNNNPNKNERSLSSSAVFFTVEEYHSTHDSCTASASTGTTTPTTTTSVGSIYNYNNPLLLQQDHSTVYPNIESDASYYEYDYMYEEEEEEETNYVDENTKNIMHYNDNDVAINDDSTSLFQDEYGEEQERQIEEEENVVVQLPVWLRRDKSLLVDKNIEQLRSAMVSPSSFFADAEVTQLLDAIQLAAYEDHHKMAGAAEFCRYMVESMEMGLNSLIAAAFHYCECIDARDRSMVQQQQLQQQESPPQQQFNYMDIINNNKNKKKNDYTCGTCNTDNAIAGDDESSIIVEEDLSHWEFQFPPQGIEQFDEHAVRIERDCARLKRLEIVASMVIHQNNNKQTNIDSNGNPNVTKKAADNLRDLYTTEAKDWRALAIRGAACLYRLRGILQDQEEKKKNHSNSNNNKRNGEEEMDIALTMESNRVCREAFHIYAPLASRMGMHRLKNELEHAAFKILYRRQHRTYESLLRQTRSAQCFRSAARRAGDNNASATATANFVNTAKESSNEPNIGESMEEILSYVQNVATEFLSNDAVFMASVTNFEVTARVKESYSAWKKMIRNRFDHITQVPDAMALRIVLDAKKEHADESDDVTRARERALCYYVQQLCQTAWVPHHDNPRFKDYIANPKENGYQSLHYTATTKWKNNEEWKMEIQVRTGEMHKVAEFGVASHWKYKYQNDEFGKVSLNNKHNQSSDAYLRSLQDWHWQQHGGLSVTQQQDQDQLPPLVLWDDEAESRERAERISSRTQRLKPYLEALANEQTDLLNKNVFIFLTPKLSSASSPSSSQDTELGENNCNSNNESLISTEGTVVALPAGSSILDVIVKCNLPVPANSFVGGVGYDDDAVTQNDIPASLSSRLQNGDVLSIPSFTAC